jgi:hypothetical protein
MTADRMSLGGRSRSAATVGWEAGFEEDWGF